MPRIRYVKSKREQAATKREIRRKKSGKSHNLPKRGPTASSGSFVGRGRFYR